MAQSKLAELAEFGQSIWLDSISRSMIESGELKKAIESGLRGMTSNPTIFDKAISSGHDYDDAVRQLHSEGKSTFEIYDDLTVRDVQDAADLFRPVYESTSGLDGYVSLEINPKLAHQTEETVAEGKRLYQKVNRPNVMFKVPATDAGFPAIEELIASGINVNITLIFSLGQYIRTANAYLKGMKRLLDAGGSLKKMASVASVFVSRVDTAIDKMIDAKIAEIDDASAKRTLTSLRGKAAVANSKLVYQDYLELFQGGDFLELQSKGAQVQRVLWGSTGTKDPSYSDIKYVTEIMGKPTVNTLPQNTLDAFVDHGEIAETLTANIDDAKSTFAMLKDFEINIADVCATLLEEGLVSFEQSFDSLLSTIKEKSG